MCNQFAILWPANLHWVVYIRGSYFRLVFNLLIAAEEFSCVICWVTPKVLLLCYISGSVPLTPALLAFGIYREQIRMQ